MIPPGTDWAERGQIPPITTRKPANTRTERRSMDTPLTVVNELRRFIGFDSPLFRQTRSVSENWSQEAVVPVRLCGAPGRMPPGEPSAPTRPNGPGRSAGIALDGQPGGDDAGDVNEPRRRKLKNSPKADGPSKHGCAPPKRMKRIPGVQRI